MEDRHVKVEVSEGLAVVTIDRPEALNALNNEIMDSLHRTFHALGKDESLRVVVLTGAGKAFVAGADIREMAGFSPPEARAFARKGQRIFAEIAAFPHPVIAAVNGFALGGGLELALACDLRIASEKAKLGQPEVGLGVTPGFGGTQRLPRVIGRAAAAWLLFTGEVIDAQRALHLGLVSEVVAPEALLARCREVAAVMAQKGPLAVSYCKQAVAAGMEMSLDQGLAYEAELFAQLFATADQKEGMQAFVEKRPARFAGR